MSLTAWLRMLLVVVLCHAHAVDEEDIPCQHDVYQQADHGGFVGRGVDVVFPQAYAHADESLEQRRMHAAAGSTETGFPLRIVVSALDVHNSNSTCQTIGQSVPDFGGGRLLCADNADLLDGGKIASLLQHAIPSAINRLVAVIRTKSRSTASLSAFQGACPYFTIPESQISGGIPNADISLYIAASKTYGQTIAWSSLCGVDQYNRPIFGRLNVGSRYLPSNWTAAGEFQRERLVRVLMHELVHLLGFSYDYMMTFLPSSLLSSVKGLRGKPHTVVVWVGERGVQAARDQLSCPSLSFVELEDQGGAGTALSHLERHTFLQELMNGVSGARWRGNQLSAVTLGILHDTGHYVTNAADGEPMAWGSLVGCSLVTDRCVEGAPASVGVNLTVFMPPMDQTEHFCSPNHTIVLRAAAELAVGYQLSSARHATPSAWEGTLYHATREDSMGMQSTYDHLAFGVCKTYRASSALPAGMQYYPDDPRLGGNMSLVDFCPVVLPPVVATDSGVLVEVQQCYDPSIAAPGVWTNRTLEDPSDSSRVDAWMPFRGPHAAALDVITLTKTNCTIVAGDVNRSHANDSSSTEEEICDWSWSHDVACVEMRCVVTVEQLWTDFTDRHRSPKTPEQWAAVSLQWRLAPSSPARTMAPAYTSSSNTGWYTCEDPLSAGTLMFNSTVNATAIAGADVSTTYFVFGRCPRSAVVCLGELWRDALWEEGPTTAPPQTTSTTAPPQTTSTTSVPPTTVLPTTSVPTSEPPTTDRTMESSTAMPLSPPPSPVYTAPTATVSTSPPPSTVALRFEWRWSGLHWSAVLRNSLAATNLTNAIQTLVAAQWNISRDAVSVVGLRVGSLIADVHLLATAAPLPVNASTTVDVSTLRAIYADTSGATDSIVLQSVSESHSPVPATLASDDGWLTVCTSRGWCLGLVIGIAVGLAAGGSFLLLRFVVCDRVSNVVVDCPSFGTATGDVVPESPLPQGSTRRPKASFRFDEGVADGVHLNRNDAGTPTRVGRQLSIVSTTGLSAIDSGSPTLRRDSLPRVGSSNRGWSAVGSDSEVSTIQLRGETEGGGAGTVATAWDTTQSGTSSPLPCSPRRVESLDGTFSAMSSPRATPRGAPPIVGRRRRYWN